MMGYEDQGAVLQCLPDTWSWYGYGGAYQLADATVLIDPGGAWVRIVASHCTMMRACSATVGSRTPHGANHCVRYSCHEEDFNVFVQTTATVEAGVITMPSQWLYLPRCRYRRAEAGVGHRLDVDVAQSLLTSALHRRHVVSPAGLEQVVHLTIADGSRPRPSVRHSAVIERTGLAPTC